MEKPINVLGRLVVIEEGKLLVVKKSDWTFLPGGHVEYNEGVKATIRRECLEEFGQKVLIDDFVGVFEHSFNDKNGPYHELNFVFTGKLIDIHYPEVIKSLEDDIEIVWIDVDKLEENNLLPEKLREIVQNIDLERGKWWSSIEV